jgi:hypothetical protein
VVNGTWRGTIEVVHTFAYPRGHTTSGGVTVSYHSSNPSDPDVYHDSDTCPTGQQIPATNRVPGKGVGNRPCKQCAS